jgi:hypothetical protein
MVDGRSKAFTKARKLRHRASGFRSRAQYGYNKAAEYARAGALTPARVWAQKATEFAQRADELHAEADRLECL